MNIKKTAKFKVIMVVPFANESRNKLIQYMKEKLEFLKRNQGYLFIFVNDKTIEPNSNAQDAVYYQVFGHDSEYSVLLHNRKSSSIKGGAVYSGMAFALENYEAGLIGYMDVDNSVQIESAFKAIPDVQAADVFLGIRNQRALPDKVASVLYSVLIKILHPTLIGKISDLQNGFKLFKPSFIGEFFEKVPIKDISLSFDSDPILFALQKKYSIQEFEVQWIENNIRTARSFHNIIRTMKTVLRKRFFPGGMQVYKFSDKLRDIDEDKFSVRRKK